MAAALKSTLAVPRGREVSPPPVIGGVQGLVARWGLVWTFPVLTAVAAVRLLSFDFRAGVAASVLIAPLLILWPRLLGSQRLTNLLFVAYFVVHVLSGLAYVFYSSEHPELFAYGLHYNVLPMACYLLGAVATVQGKRERALDLLLAANFATIVVGIALHFLKPGFYLSFQRLLDSNLYDMYGGDLPRMSSYMGSMIVGNVCVVSLALMLFGRPRSFWVHVTATLVFLAGAVLSLQRSAWGAAVLVMAIAVVARPSEPGLEALSRRRRRGNVGAVIVTMLALGVFSVYSPTTMDRVLFRASSMETAAEERADQWDTAIELFETHPLGMGIGAAGHKASEHGQAAVPDSNYFRILVELGPQGLTLFLILVAASLRSGVRRREWALTLALGVHALQSLGNNFFDLYYSAHMWWFLLGVLNSDATATAVTPRVASPAPSRPSALAA